MINPESVTTRTAKADETLYQVVVTTGRNGNTEQRRIGADVWGDDIGVPEELAH